MKVVVCPADDGACGHYRMIWPAETLERQGHDAVVDHAHTDWQVICEDGPDGEPRVVDAIDPADADVVVFQRVLHRRRVEHVEALQRRGIAVVIDVDDDFHRVDPHNVAAPAIDGTIDRHISPVHLLDACARADLVTTATPALAHRYGADGACRVVPNVVPEWYLRCADDRAKLGRQWRPGLKVLVGWSGSTQTHPGDLEVTGGAVGDVLRDHADFCHVGVVGTGEGVTAALGVDVVQHTGWVPLRKYPRFLAQLDVGVVPLKSSAFNRAKSWLKGLEMAAVGVPFVASPLPQYERLAGLGAGRLAASPRDWRREVSRLVRDDSWRAECAARGRQVAATLTIEGNAGEWWAAWSEAYDRARTRAS